MGPLKADHPLVTGTGTYTDNCPGCQQRFKEGEYVTLVTVGPGDDVEAQQAARDGRAYTAVAMAAHWKCVTGED